MMNRWLVILGLGAVVAALAGPAIAVDERAILLDQNLTTDRPGHYHAMRFSLWIEPLNTHWIAWSQYDRASEWEGRPTIDMPNPGNIGVGDFFRLTLVAPNGARSPEYLMDQNDDQGVSFGPQAVIFGTRELTPPVARSAPDGKAQLFHEPGVANEFLHAHGPGYYQFEIDFMSNENASAGGFGQFYLLINLQPGVQVKPPTRARLGRFAPMALYGGMPDDDSDDPPDDPSGRDLLVGGTFPEDDPILWGDDLWMGLPFPDNPMGGRDWIIGSNPLPDLPEPPPIPEPATLGLAALGLGLLARLRRHR